MNYDLIKNIFNHFKLIIRYSIDVYNSEIFDIAYSCSELMNYYDIILIKLKFYVGNLYVGFHLPWFQLLAYEKVSVYIIARVFHILVRCTIINENVISCYTIFIQ